MMEYVVTLSTSAVWTRGLTFWGAARAVESAVGEAKGRGGGFVAEGDCQSW